MTTWKWATQNKAYANFGNANQWTVNAGLSSLARETAQNSNDARIDGQPADLVYRFIRLSGRRSCTPSRALSSGTTSFDHTSLRWLPRQRVPWQPAN